MPIIAAMPVPRISLLALAASLGACAPALDWREVAPPTGHVRVLLPCKPASQARTLSLAGAAVEMTLHACRAEGIVFGLAIADVRDPALVPPALDALASSARVNLGVLSSPSVSQGAQVPGMTPQPRALRFRISGRSADGRALESVVVVFAYGTEVMQATALGERLDAAAVDTFVDSIAVRP